MSNKFSDVMDFVHELNKTHGVKQRGGKMPTGCASDGSVPAFLWY